jgi:hypothetical protein
VRTARDAGLVLVGERNADPVGERVSINGELATRSQ